MAVAMFVDFGDLVGASPNGLEFVCKALLVGAALVQDLVSRLEGDILVSACLGIPSLLVPAESEGVMGDLLTLVQLFKVVIDSIGLGAWSVILNGDNLSLTNLGWCVVDPFGGGVVHSIGGAPDVIGPVGLFCIDIIA